MHPRNQPLRSSTLATGKPMILGSLDVPGTTRKQEIEVVAELVKE